MSDLYRSAAGRDVVRAWCEQELADWALPHTRRTVTTGLGETSLVEAGTGASLVVYLPGTNFNAATSRPVLEALVAAGYRVACVDLPGQPGLSASTRPTDEVAGYAGWVGEVLAAVREPVTERVVLVGHSRGAAVALGAEPDAVERLLLVSPAGLLDVRPSWPIVRATVPWLVRRNDAGSRRLVDFMTGPERPFADATLVAWTTLVARRTRTSGAPGRAPDAVLHRWRGRSVHVLLGDRDCFFDADAQTRAATADLGASTLLVPGGGHLLVDQVPDVVARAVAADH